MDMRERLRREAARPRLLRLQEALLGLGCTLGLLQTGAHPDDETSSLLALLRRRLGWRIAFACATRGEGGQNALGPERGDDLGLLRTREMEEAARSLGLVLYWLGEGPGDPVRDFRFSRSAEETLARWGHPRVLERLVRVIREERPDAVCPTFLDVPGQHGHHRAMTRVAREAWEMAGDPEAFPAHAAAGLQPWAAAKFYLPAWSGAGDSYDDAEAPPAATTLFDVGEADPAMGAPYARIGEWSRALHASQGMGSWPGRAPQPRPLHLAASRIGPHGVAEAAISDGLPVTLADWADAAGAAAPLLREAQARIAVAQGAGPSAPGLAAELAAAVALLRRARPLLPPATAPLLAHRLDRQERALSRAAAIAAGVSAEFALEDGALVPGATATARVTIEGGARLVGLRLPAGWQAQARQGGRVDITVPVDTPPDHGFPTRFDPWGETAPVAAELALEVEGIALLDTVAPAGRPAVLPALSVGVRPDRVVLNRAAGAQRLEVTLQARRIGSGGPAALGLGAAPGLGVVPPITLDLAPGETREVALSVTVDPQALGDGAEVSVLADDAPALAVQVLRHAHIGTVAAARPALLRLRAVDAAIAPGTRVAYLGGGHDAVDHWLRAIGVPVATLDRAGFAAADLAAFSTVLVGIFGFGMRPDLPPATARLHGFVRDGGHLVTLYHRPGDAWRPEATPLAPIEIGRPSLRWRVTDASAPVTRLQPAHPLLAGPNPVTEAEWRGWQRERGLYFARSWDAAYAALLEMGDPEEAPLRGGLLSGRFGRGRHTHVALALHTELEALTPGAFRLMANLVQPA